MSLIKGVAVLCLLILVFSSLKSTTGLLSLVIFLVISMTGEVWLVVFLDKIPSETNLCICQSIMGLSSSLMGKGLTKNGVSSITSMSTLMLGHSPISSLEAKSLFVLQNNFHQFSFSFFIQSALSQVNVFPQDLFISHVSSWILAI